jgi:hypothetical protein
VLDCWREPVPSAPAGSEQLWWARVEPVVDAEEAAVHALAVEARAARGRPHCAAAAGVLHAAVAAGDAHALQASLVGAAAGSGGDGAGGVTDPAFVGPYEVVEYLAALAAAAAAAAPPLPPTSTVGQRADERARELAVAIWRNFAALRVAALCMWQTGVDAPSRAGLQTSCGPPPLESGGVAPGCVTRLSFWLCGALPLPADWRAHLLATPSLGERMWVELQVLWPRYGEPATQLSLDAVCEYVECGTGGREVHAALQAAEARLGTAAGVAEAAALREDGRAGGEAGGAVVMHGAGGVQRASGGRAMEVEEGV